MVYCVCVLQTSGRSCATLQLSFKTSCLVDDQLRYLCPGFKRALYTGRYYYIIHQWEAKSLPISLRSVALETARDCQSYPVKLSAYLSCCGMLNVQNLGEGVYELSFSCALLSPSRLRSTRLPYGRKLGVAFENKIFKTASIRLIIRSLGAPSG